MQLAELRKKAMALPKTPGVYLMKNDKGKSSMSAKQRHSKTVSVSISAHRTTILSRCAVWLKMSTILTIF